MDDIPQDVLHSTYESARRDSAPDFLRSVANDFRDRADRERALRKKSWQSRSKELDLVDGHLTAYADQLEAFIANNPDGVSLVGDDETRWEDPRDTVNGETDQPQPKGKKAEPQLPGNTGRCASFRRIDANDPVVCDQPRGHDGDHGTVDPGDGPTHWPRTPSGAVCGDVVILHDGTALNCQRLLGHDGDEHHDGRYRFWPRGVGTSRYVRTCERCNMDTHACPGCGEPIGHYAGDCGHDCTAPMPEPLRPMTPTELDDEALAMAQEPPLTIDDELFSGQCVDRNDDERCMLPGTHTGKHKGRRGTGWDRAPVALIGTPGPLYDNAATLGDIAEQQRAMMAIPEQRAESDPVPVFTIRESDGAAVYNGALAAPEMAHVAQMKEEVSATVADLTGDEPIGTTVNVGGIEFVKHSDNPFSAPDVAAAAAGGPAFVAGLTQGEQAQLSNPFAQGAAMFKEHVAAVNSGNLAASPLLGNPFQAPAPPPAAFLPPHMVPGEPKAHQSHSSITTMEKCGLQYRLKYRDGIGDDTPAWWNVAGTAFHTVVQAIEAVHASNPGYWATDAPLMAQEREAAAMWKEAFATLVERTERSSGKARSTWKAAKGGKEGEAFWCEFGGDLARMYVGHRRKFLAEPEGWWLLSKPGGEGWAHEVEFNATVDGVLLNGFIDAAWISADGATILIEDFKSGTSEGDPLQPKLYGAALRALGFIGDRRVITRFYEARKGAHSATVELTAADDAEVSYRANTAQQMDRMGIFPPNPSGYNCSTCPVKSRCPIMATKGN